MPGWAFIPFFAALCGIGCYVFTLWCTISFRLRQTVPREESFTPPVSILKPLCGMDPHAYESLRSHCLQDYPQYEIIFGVADPADEIVPVVQKLIEEFPQVPIKLVYSPEVLGSNLKVSNLLQMLPNARHDFLLINDSDIHVPRTYLRQVLAPLEDSSTGMTTCLFRCVAGRTIGSKLEALGISSDFIPGVLCAKRLDGGIRFALGSTLAFSRRALAQIGGLAPLADFLADDYQIGYRMSQAGLRVELAGCIVDHHLPEYSFREFLQHQLRWARAVRTSRPGGYAGLIFTYVIPWSLLTVLLTSGAAWTWLLFACAVILRYSVWLAAEAHVLREPRPGKGFWLLPVRDLVNLAVWFASYLGREVVWRGRRFELVNGKLQSRR
ncbi:MAG TPA: bacteriohopanetetrol glucosamine biosynthesis glycosyltransferase HpnI [Terriglobia bacterium]|jgi:ceramide glucosyltransferase